MALRGTGADKNLFLRTSREIEYVKQHGRRVSNTVFNMLICKIGDGNTRVAIIVGRKFGTAVRRNRAKRLFRELVRHIHTELVSGHLLVVFPKRDALTLPFKALAQTWRFTLRRHGIIIHGECC
ncbi:ribonuclease P protein component [Nitrospira sp. KM1]|uniref:ribonuclease P protein component n=1 Tax=Nitrospira sp. KM1 TaxID=1936990 RepID=UPI0015663B32|nr:ribonuclease P protein component [Nitrospira sp. KM1]